MVKKELGKEKDKITKDELKRIISNVVEFTSEIEKMRKLYINKNISYGDSFATSLKNFGIISAITRIDDKWNRIINIAQKKPNLILNEKTVDDLIDISNYCVMTLMEINSGRLKLND